MQQGFKWKKDLRKIRSAQTLKCVLLLLILCCFSNCFKHYYKSISIANYKKQREMIPNIIMYFQKNEKYIIICHNNNYFHLMNIQLDTAAKTIIGYAEPVIKKFEKLLADKGDVQIARYDVEDKGFILGEAIVYISEYEEYEIDNPNIVIPISAIKRIDINKRVVGKTFWSSAFIKIGVIGGTIGGMIGYFIASFGGG